MSAGRTADPAHHLEYLREHISDWQAFADACVAPLPTCIWLHPTRSMKAPVRQMLVEEGFHPAPVAWADDVLRVAGDVALGTSFLFLMGAIHVQEEVSILAADVAGATPGQRVLDLCAAPGGKTARLSLRWMENAGTMVANDMSSGRVRALRGNLDRLGVANASVTCRDATTYPVEGGGYDLIFVDAPCSCSGTLRKSPRVLFDIGAQTLAGMAAVQRSILTRAVDLCRPGGTILYTTCSFSPEENEVVVDQVLHDRDGQLSLAEIPMGSVCHSKGIAEWNGNRLGPSIDRCVRVYPHQNDTGGFFLALLQKHA